MDGKSLLSVMLVVSAGVVLAPAGMGAGLTLGSPFNSGMVLQRGKSVPVWGRTEPGARVTVDFAGQTAEAVAGADGRWRVDLKPLETSSAGRDFIVTASSASRASGRPGNQTIGQSNNRAILHDVLVGEVWLCSGQSNMQQPLGGGGSDAWSDENGSIEAKLTDEPDIRYASFGGAASATVKDQLQRTNAVWKSFTTENLYRFANVPYHFAMNLRRGLKGVPIGLVHASVGGSNIRPWISAEGYAAVPELDDMKKAGTLLDETTPEGRKLGFWGRAAQPTVFFNSQIAPIGPYALRGLIWYQGESNINDGDRYRLYLHALVRGWRKALENPDMDAYVVQLMPCLYRNAKDTALGEFWTAQQKFAAEDPHAAYVVTDDLGLLDEIHSPHKRNVGLRLALCALNRQYGRKDLEYRSPRLKSARAEAGRVTLEFEFGARLYTPVCKGSVRNFELAGADDIWHDAVGRLEDGRVALQCDEVTKPLKVRYMYRQGMQGDLYACGTHLMPGAFVADVEQTPLDDDLQAKCQAVCDWAVKEGLQGALQFCAYRDGRCIVDVCAGTMTTNAGSTAISESTLFPIFSTEKPFLATAVHRTVEQGKMAYDKPLSTWWPQFKGDGKEKLTLRETLGYRSGMCAGFPVGVGGVEDECNWKKICDLAAQAKPEIEPGTKQRYMSISYAWMLGRPLEIVWGGKALNAVLCDQVLVPAGISCDFYFAADKAALPRIATVYKSESFERMNDDRRRMMCLPSAYAVADARGIARFYNRLCGFDGKAPLIRKETLDNALKPSRHESDPLPSAEDMRKNWYMIFGLGYGLWGEADDIARVFGHGGVGGSEGLCDRSQRLTVGFTCNFDKDVRKVRSKLYGIVGMKWRYWDDAEADIQNMQMSTIGR